MIAAEAGFEMSVLQLRKVAAKLHLQSRSACRKRELREFGHDALQELQPGAPFFFRRCGRGFVILPLNQLPRRGNSYAAKNSFGLADVDLFRWKINVGTESRQFRLGRFRIVRRNRESDLRVTDIESVQERLPMEECRIINIERDLADDGDRVLAFFVIENAHVACDEPAERIECETLD